MKLSLNTINNTINCKYITDANDLENIQGWYCTSENTINLPDELYTAEESQASCSCVLFTSTVDWDNCNWGIQLLYPIDGKYSNSYFVRNNFTSEDYGYWIEFMNRENMQNTWDWIEGNEDWTQQIQDQVDNLTSNDVIYATNGETTIDDEITSLWEEVAELLQGPDISDLAFGNFALIDNATEGCTSAGALTTDLMASNGKAYIATTTSSALNLFTATFPEVKFGKYSLCMRLKISANTSTSAVLTANILNGSTNILNKSILGTSFDKTDNYCYICTTFDYDGSSGSAKQPLQLNINTGTISGLEVRFDYAYITLITPAVYI